MGFSIPSKTPIFVLFMKGLPTFDHLMKGQRIKRMGHPLKKEESGQQALLRIWKVVHVMYDL